MVCRKGFTLIELAVVLATVALLAAMLLPALAQTRQNSQVIECQANQRQLAVAWMMYARDNNDKLVPVGSLAYQPASFGENPLNDVNLQPGGILAQFCPGNLQSSVMTAGHYYTNWIKAGLIYPYIQNIAVYKCPADLSMVPYNFPATFPRPSERTYSVNCYVGGMQWWDPNYKLYRKLSDMNRPGPAHTWVFIEESPTSIDDCYFALDPATPNLWYNSPAVLHGNASVLTYADGHSEAHRWTDSFMMGVRNPQNPPGINVPADPKSGDLAWLFSVSTVHN
ncbi:MAG: prepilin-type N-terminal cleavage/methylation domain-containing protein [Verrucomicrobiota bacterium]|jgi:prepilin-type N-terminal cleavage/methylation domain-containing protein